MGKCFFKHFCFQAFGFHIYVYQIVILKTIIYFIVGSLFTVELCSTKLREKKKKYSFHTLSIQVIQRSSLGRNVVLPRQEFHRTCVSGELMDDLE